MWSRLASSEKCASAAIESSRFINSKWKYLNAFVAETWDEAEKTAVTLENHKDEYENSPLYGMPLAVKDNFCTKGLRTSCGSKMLDNFVPPYTATVVERLVRSGMIVVGKTNMDSFAMGSGSTDGLQNPTKNPWTWVSRRQTPGQDQAQNYRLEDVSLHSNDDDFRISGGSSGGSAAVVSAGIVYGALGSDTGGSVRIPAAYCGVVGLKPTYGLLSRHGLVALVNSLDCPGILTQTVPQCTHMLNVVAGHDINDSTTYHSKTYTPIKLSDNPTVAGLKVGVPYEYHSPHTSDEVIDTWDKVVDDLVAAGAVVQRVSLPHTQYSIACYAVINSCEVASNMARYDGVEFGHRGLNEESTEALYAQTRHEGFSDVVRGRIFAGNYFLLKKNYDKYYLKASQIRRKIYDEFKSVFNTVDILVTPTTITDAPMYSYFSAQDNRTQCAMQDVYTQPSNLAGVPAISLPVRLSKNSLPLSIQLISRPFDENTLLQTAYWLEVNSKFPRLFNGVSS